MDKLLNSVTAASGATLIGCGADMVATGDNLGIVQILSGALIVFSAIWSWRIGRRRGY